MTRAWRGLLVPLIVVAVVAVVAGCGADRDGADGPATREAEHVPVAALRLQADLRKVVYTADLTVRVDDAARAAQRATEFAKEADGLVFAQRSDLAGREESHLTLKVPPARFEPVLAALAGLGRALEREIEAEDVTEEVVDVEGRLKTAQASADRLRTLLGAATSTADIVAVEGELAKRESAIESLQGRLRVLGSQVDLATINVWLTERTDLEVNANVPGVLEALRAGWVTLLNVTLAVAAIGGFLLPFVPVALVLWWAIRRYRRSRRQAPPPSGA